MTKLRLLLWLSFPALSFFSWCIFAGLFTDTLHQISFVLLPLAIPFYLWALLFTIPINIFTVIAFVKGRILRHNGGKDYRMYFVAGGVNLLISILWAISIFGFGWILTA